MKFDIVSLNAFYRGIKRPLRADDLLSDNAKHSIIAWRIYFLGIWIYGKNVLRGFNCGFFKNN